jgi:hypothetical protein
MADPLIRIHHGRVRGHADLRTPWVPVPAGCEELALHVRLECAPSNTIFDTWLEGTNDEKTATAMNSPVCPSPGNSVMAQIQVPTQRAAVRACLETRGDPDALIQYSLIVFPEGPVGPSGGAHG